MSEPSEGLDRTPESREELYAKKEFSILLDRLRHLPGPSRAKLQGDFTQRLVDETFAVDTPVGRVSFVLLGKTAAGRATSLLTRQPGTIEWINSFRPDSVFWDVGANVGVYTLYAAMRGGTTVVAFEPAAVNYFLLAANCEANRLDDRVDCLLLGLGSERAIARLHVSQFGSARSFSFRERGEHQHGGRQPALIMSMDQLIEEYELPCPNYIKIDAPGLTEAIVIGGTRLLRRPDVRELHIEVREQSKAGQRLVEMLRQAGFAVVGRHPHGGSADLTFARESV
jgi:FkbM family methyltransferase